MKYLFPEEKIRKFFDILDRLDRTVQKQYIGAEPLNPTLGRCQQEVFVRRTLNRWLKGKCYKQLEMGKTGFITNYMTDEHLRLPQYRYIKVNVVAYIMGYGQEIEVRISDASKPVELTNSIGITHNDALRLVGEEITLEQFEEIQNLFTAPADEKIEVDSSDVRSTWLSKDELDKKIKMLSY